MTTPSAGIRRHAISRMAPVALAWTLGVSWAGTVRAEVVTFQDVSLPQDGYLNGNPGGLQPGQRVDQPLVSGGVSFSNTYGVDAYGVPPNQVVYPYWYGFSFSNVVNTTDGTWTNQYASYPGGGYDSTQYAVVYAAGATVRLPGPATVAGFRIANTTYARSTMVSADPEQFASPLQPPGGFFSVTAIGLLGSATTGTVDFFLADFRGASPPGVLGGWSWFSLEALGEVDAVSFAFDGSDVGDYGLNTAAYFAMDDFTFMPVPESGPVPLAVLAGLALAATWSSRRAGMRGWPPGTPCVARESPPATLKA